MIINGNEKEFNDLIKDGAVLVDFYATWCGPCKMLSPVLEELSNDRSDIKIIKIDVDQNEALAKSFGIMSVPTMKLFKDGNEIYTNTGFMPKELIIKLIQEKLDLN